jgi:outer membrane protein OmpA-like peptidoglycan-associated protein
MLKEVGIGYLRIIVRGEETMKKSLYVLLGTALLAACNNEEASLDTDVEENQETEQTEEIEEVEELDPLEELLAREMTAEPIQVERTFWNAREDAEMDITLEVGPFIQDEEFAILPLSVSTESDASISFSRLFDLWGTGESITASSGYGIRVFDADNLTVSHIAVISGEYIDTSSDALQTFIGEGSRNEQMQIRSDKEEPVRYFAAFAKTEADDVEVMLETLGVIENVPVVSREESGYFTFSEVEEAIGEREEDEINDIVDEEELVTRMIPNDLEILENELNSSTFERVGSDYVEHVQARTEPLERYSEALETTMHRIDEVEHSTLILSSDVLFEFDAAELTEAADSELKAVVNELQDIDSGDLEIVGHTDNEGTEEYNQQLSEERADSVYTRLEELMDLEIFDSVTTSGESLREPIADNGTEEGRAQNRRVELHFTPPTEEVEREITEEIPEALGVEAVYPEPVETEDGEIEVESIRRVGNVFIGTVKVSSTSENRAQYDALTHRAGVGARGWYSDETGYYTQWTAYPVSILHNGRRYYPLDYYLSPLEGSAVEDRVEGQEELNYIVPLAERRLPGVNDVIEEGYYHATFVWPAFDVDEITVDLGVSTVYSDFEEIDEYDIENDQPWRISHVPIEEELSHTNNEAEEDE